MFFSISIIIKHMQMSIIVIKAAGVNPDWVHYFESVSRIRPMRQQQLHHSQMSSSTGQRNHRVIIIGSGSVHIST